MILKKTTAALAGLAMSGGVAAAAVATTDLNMRAGPGTDHQVIGVIPEGAPVSVLGCGGSWCQVNFSGRVGYANAAYLGGGDAAVVVQPAPAYGGYAYGGSGYGYPGYYDYGYSYGPSVGFGFSYGDRRWRRGDNWRGNRWSGNRGDNRGGVGRNDRGPRGAMGADRGPRGGIGTGGRSTQGPLRGGASVESSGGGQAAATVGRGGGGRDSGGGGRDNSGSGPLSVR